MARLSRRTILLILIPVLILVVSLFAWFILQRDSADVVQREVEAKAEMSRIVDLVLQQEDLEVDLVKLNYQSSIPLKNVYGFLSACHAQGKNLNLLELVEQKERRPSIKFVSSIIENKEEIRNYFATTPCASSNEVRLYGLFFHPDGYVAGWVMNLNKDFKSLR